MPHSENLLLCYRTLVRSGPAPLANLSDSWKTLLRIPNNKKPDLVSPSVLLYGLYQQCERRAV